MTIQGFCQLTISLERFNRAVNRLSSSTYDEGYSQGIANVWGKEELRSVLEAGKFQTTMNNLFDRFVERLDNCNRVHAAMLHLKGSWSIDILLSSCSENPTWRQVVCDVAPNSGCVLLARLYTNRLKFLL